MDYAYNTIGYQKNRSFFPNPSLLQRFPTGKIIRFNIFQKIEKCHKKQSKRVRNIATWHQKFLDLPLNYIYCINYRSFAKFPRVEILWNAQFLQNFSQDPIKNLGWSFEIAVKYFHRKPLKQMFDVVTTLLWGNLLRTTKHCFDN